MTPDVLIAIINALGTVLAALTAGLCAAFVGKRFADRKALEARLKEAQEDILFLLEVERRYGSELSILGENGTRKNTIREQVRQETMLTWSGKNTPGRIANSPI